MSAFVEELSRYIDMFEEAVWSGNRNSIYCYVDISTAKSAERTNIRIYPSEGRNGFFKNAIKDVVSKLGDIHGIIFEAKSTNPIDRIRIIISRDHNNSVKQLIRYVSCDNEFPIIMNDILTIVHELDYKIRL